MSERILIDKLENLETKHGVEINVNAFLEYNDYNENFEAKVIGEVFGEIEYDIKIIISAYNNIGEIIGTEYTTIEEENFEGIQPFSETIDAPKGEVISKLRIYPQKY
ncbi:hypothetical protein [Paenisporosarcina antarctica]|uniref:Uncharacterized protein n=1 Tax=Paenisporosarcina antarctica TaxID=417367 RepID=A0A4P7A0Q1_9BACL|nr:hypothetical protein [Paenisporosarcina antarctica]QBP41979.1 hypothetical protein E2636_12825 [Paenisporosarcina antarctica]